MMNTVHIKLAPSDVMFSAGLRADPRSTTALMLSRYETARHKGAVIEIRTHLDGEDACEEAFDLTNNPSRQGERELVYGRGRSVSVGDVVEVNGVPWVCCNVGWKQIDA